MIKSEMRVMEFVLNGSHNIRKMQEPYNFACVYVCRLMVGVLSGPQLASSSVST